MDNFLKNKLNDYDAGFDNSAWDAIESRVQENNNGTESLKNNLSGYDAGFNQNAWGNIAGIVAQNNLAYRSSLMTRKIASAAVFVGVLISSVIGYSVFNEPAEQIAEIKSENNNNIIEKSNLIPITEVEKTISKEESIIENKIENKVISINNNDLKPINSSDNTNNEGIVTSPSPTIEKTKIELPKLYLDKDQYCLGESLNAKIIGASGKNYKIRVAKKWLTNNNLIAYQFNKPGEFKVELFELNSENNLTKIESRKVIVHDKANAKFYYNKDKQNDIPVTHFELADKNLTSVNWYVGNRLIASSQTVNYTFINKGKYPVKLVTSNPNGCKDSSTQTIRVLKAYNLLATQIFNPKTETWLPLGLKKSNNSFEIKIISAEGEQAFETTNAENEWNGVIEESGKKAKDGDEFYWIARVTNTKGQIREYAGSFIISSVLH